MHETLPLDMTSAGTPVAAMAEVMAYLRWLTLIFLCQRLQVLVGANMRPPRHIFPKAPWPDLWVPPPLTRGIRATARPVPQDSADVWCPANKMIWNERYGNPTDHTFGKTNLI